MIFTTQIQKSQAKKSLLEALPVDLSRGHTVESIKAHCEEEGDCWLWGGYMAKHMTPMLCHRRRSYGVRQVMAFITKHPNSGLEGVWSTSCGTPGCVHPEHLVYRTKKQHSMHMAKALSQNKVALRLRNDKIARSVARKVPIEEIQNIRSSSEPANVLAKRYDVSESLIYRYRRGGRGIITGPWGGLV